MSQDKEEIKSSEGDIIPGSDSAEDDNIFDTERKDTGKRGPGRKKRTKTPKQMLGNKRPRQEAVSFPFD